MRTSLSFTENGQPLPESFVLSMASWAFGIIQTHGIEALSRGDSCDVEGLNAPQEEARDTRNKQRLPGLTAKRTDYAKSLPGALAETQPEELASCARFSDFVQLVIDRCRLHSVFDGPPTHRVKSIMVRKPPANQAAAKAPAQASDDFPQLIPDQ